MKQNGQKVQLVTFRPGKRMYGKDDYIIRDMNKKRMVLYTIDRAINIVIEAADNGELDGDPLGGPPKVEVTEYFWDHRKQNPQKESYSAYYYELGDNGNNIFLVL